MIVNDFAGRGYIGGGSIAAILGVSPFQSPLDAYLSIVEDSEETLQKRAFFDRRKALEPFAARCFELHTGRKVIFTNNRYDDAHFDWAKAEIDFETDDGANGETKSVRSEMAWMWPEEESGDEPPMYVTAQAMWGLGITGKDKCYVHALIGLDDDRVYEVHRDDVLIEDIRATANRFWKHHIVPRRIPEPTTLEDLRKLYPKEFGRFVEASKEIAETIEEMEKLKVRLKQFQTARDITEYKVKAFMRDASTLTINNKAVATWKARADGVRTFRLK
jgi:putative phage-type endonuclease